MVVQGCIERQVAMSLPLHRQPGKRGKMSLRSGLILLLAQLLCLAEALAAEKMRLQLRWLHQFQFAGYYMAQEKGFYRQAGLEVDIRQGGPGSPPALDSLLAGDADSVTSELMRIALVTAKQYQLELTSVRPQRTAKLGIVDERAFAIQLTGSSQAVIAAIRSIDSTKSRFVVRSIQLSPLDSAGVSMVTANVVVVGYQGQEVRPA